MSETRFITDIWLGPEPEQLAPDLAVQYLELLSETEKQRWQRFHFAGDRDRFLHARALVRYVLGACLEVPPGQLQFTANAWGKPELDSRVHPASKIQFNLSHTQGMAVLATSFDAAVGVDVEDVFRRVELPALARRYFAPDEVSALLKLPPAALSEQFFSLWTLKEAYLKALGMGLRIPLQEFSFQFDNKAVPRVSHAGSEFENITWQFASLLVEDRFRLALAMRKPSDRHWQIRLHKGVPGQGFVRINL